PPKYDGNIHPDEWINDFQNYFNLKKKLDAVDYLEYAISLVDPIIKLPTGIDDFEKLRNALKEDISFTVFKNTNKRKLQSLTCIPEKDGGETSKFISNFRKYLGSINNLRYTTGSGLQLVFASNYDSNALWKITFTSGKELASYTDTNIYLQHKSSSNFLGIYCGYYKSPVTQHTEVNCYSQNQWKFNHNKLENYQGYLKSNDIINLSFTNQYSQQEYLRSHDFQFTINNDTFQEVVCHNERLGGTDEWCIKLIK
ncbi:334_t:CDS:2, partial [Funneliformis geosporum]